ncbi:CDP-glucose 4,6-dehydratase [Spirosoma sp. KNUC1025]|uniref:CDP-glucose 4,6-dehydratase n=1 Tax=Spirosoma sp. KNUC1025 TaxID=2894082 RepID=UPI003864AB0D|nr:CDP-glucose 4,6-dehydratase [Spirosoma sp. KNUC1025]
MMTTLFGGRYLNKTVLITGHMGFKGSWLAFWLHQLGAKVVGYSLPTPSQPAHWPLLNLPIDSHEADINNIRCLQKVISQTRPEIVFHLAAQPLVRQSYQNPLETLQTNIIGTANVLECVRQTPSVRAVVIVTSDKSYQNPEDGHPLRESDPMGGYDPYSVSKGCAELITASYRSAYFNPNQYGSQHQTLVASGRAGNVIGGGDWAADRLLPDLMRAANQNQTVVIRNPTAIRPWQHVLEPLSGYLLLGQQLLEGNGKAAEGWNFGPATDDVLSVRAVIEQAQTQWDKISVDEQPASANLHEAHLLRLDCTKANQQLNWRPVWSTKQAIERTVGWYQTYYQAGRLLTETDLYDYICDAQLQNSVWTQAN